MTLKPNDKLPGVLTPGFRGEVSPRHIVAARAVWLAERGRKQELAELLHSSLPGRGFGSCLKLAGKLITRMDDVLGRQDLYRVLSVGPRDRFDGHSEQPEGRTDSTGERATWAASPNGGDA